MKFAVAFALMTIAVSMCSAAPGFIYSYPAATQDVSVVRDALGNQATAYAYQNGHSAVAVSRSDVSKHLAVIPQPIHTVHAAPYVYHQAAYQPAYPAYHAPYYYL